MTPRAKRADHVYDLLLRVYPAAHKERFGEEMRQLFRDICKDAKANPSPMFWFGAILDVFKGAALAHMELIRRDGVKNYLEHSANKNSVILGALLLFPAGLFFVLKTIFNICGKRMNSIETIVELY